MLHTYEEIYKLDFPFFLTFTPMKRLLFWSIFLCLGRIAWAQSGVEITQLESSTAIPPSHVYCFKDSTKLLSLKQISPNSFKPFTKNDYNLGYSPDRYWFKFDLKNNTQNTKWLFIVEGTLLDEVWLYTPQPDGTYIEKISGDNYTRKQREVNSPLFGFNIELSTQSSSTYYLAVQSNDTKQFKMMVSTPQSFYMEVGSYLNVYTFYFGMLVMLMLYNLLLYFSIRDIMYLYYVLYILSFGLLQFTIVGFGNQYLWGNYPWMSNHSTGIWTSLSTLFITLFAYKFLNVKNLAPKLLPLFYYLLLCSLFLFVLNIQNSNHRINAFNGQISLLNTVIIFIIGTYVLLKGYKPARYYMIAWGILFAAIVIYILHTAAIITHPWINYTILPMGAIVEATILSFALGKRIYEIEKDNVAAQQEVIHQMQEKEREKTRIARDLHDDLGSTISSIRYMGEMLKHHLTNSEIVDKIIDASQNVQETLHDIVWTTQATEESLPELIARLSRFAGELLELSNVKFSPQVDPSIDNLKLPPAKLYNIAMIFKEAINNIAKHAEAKNVTVEFVLIKSYFCLSILDDGRGFDTASIYEGNGLKNIAARCKDIEGSCDVESKSGSTKIVVKIPV
jgi:signal transduction histidine kinase